MSTKRRSYETGHKRKYLVVIDDTEECDRAIFWAAKRASRTKSVIVLLRVIETGDRNQPVAWRRRHHEGRSDGGGESRARQAPPRGPKRPAT